MNDPRYYRPKTVAEALTILSGEGPDARPLGGGTDLMVRMRAGLMRPKVLVDIGRIGLDTIHPAGDTTVIGAMCTMAQLQRDATVCQQLPALAQAASRVGANQIQHMATVGGNVCNASPAADTACALVALEARVMLRRVGGVRSLPIGEFLRGPGQTALEPGELLEAFSIPTPASDQTAHQSFNKVGGRNALVCSLVAVAGLTRLADGVVQDCRLALAAVGPTCLRPSRAEALITGEALSEELCRTAAAAAAAEAQPIDDHRATGEYRRRLVAALVREHLLECMQS
jgi:CO/xanthine dehydrogenase FAD-binding subunit